MNIKDVAELSGVSPATVSRYINNVGNIAPESAKRIERVLDLTGYKVSKNKKSVSINNNPVIGVVIPSLLNPVFSEIVSGIQARARHFGLSIVVVDTQYDPDREKEAVIDLIRQKVIGVILTISNVLNDEALEILEDFKFPFCLLHNQAIGDGACVYIDNYQAGWDVALELTNLGHKRFGMVTGRFSSSDRAKKRYRGFKDCLKKQGVESIELLEVDQNNVEAFNQTQIEIFKSLDAPTAWFCSNDLLALKTLNALRNMQIKVPEQVSVIGFDGMELAQLVSGALATVMVPHLKMGRVAVDLLCNLKNGANVPTNVMLDYEINLSGTVDKNK